MYSHEQALKIAAEVQRVQRGKSKEQIVKKGLLNLTKILDNRPDYYYAFGPYWWIIKKLMKKYVDIPGKWYCSGVYDAVSVVRYGFDDEFLDFVTAMYYHNDHFQSRPSTHYFEDSEGNDRVYTLYDEDAPAL